MDLITALGAALLARDDWRDVIGRLGAHFGENAALPEAPRREIEEFLVRHAGNR